MMSLMSHMGKSHTSWSTWFSITGGWLQHFENGLLQAVEVVLRGRQVGAKHAFKALLIV